ncbi:histone-like nucleoid-structuring protein, MvaT/MvaU family [Pseudomonas sp.]|uniref:histone-like nucleoid-structuring protein, MvaT/MvaU family n=1 Tax=Pseudomonas sp. TaxID=306 RepID=UPI0029073F34|nr:histone-like nucleoid-structuring protein, MvaT/MvaU family [Pseudomonas sp.]MDU4254427.1 histone-like nucleoid-structuring protein, MvaT/MvaU family [Pseudomonas sp.]
MSLLVEYRECEQALQELEARLAALSADGELKKELEFEGKLKELMDSYAFTPSKVLSVLNPDGVKIPSVERQRRERTTSVYKNPTTGEIVETRGPNNRILKAWKAQYGADVVKGWKQP